MENEGWAGLFKIARGEEAKIWSKTAFGSKRVVVSPDFDTRLAAYRLITGYGYGRPAELASADDSGRTVTDVLTDLLKASGKLA